MLAGPIASLRPRTGGLAVSVVSTNPARCRDCYRCVRTCPVKAVRVASGQAEVAPELCIECGECVRACPQQAKVVRDDVTVVKAALAEGRTVVATVAPSVAAYFGGEGDSSLLSFEPVATALRGLGFAAAGETAVGAAMIAPEHTSLDGDAFPAVARDCLVVPGRGQPRRAVLPGPDRSPGAGGLPDDRARSVSEAGLRIRRLRGVRRAVHCQEGRSDGCGAGRRGGRCADLRRTGAVAGGRGAGDHGRPRPTCGTGGG